MKFNQKREEAAEHGVAATVSKLCIKQPYKLGAANENPWSAKFISAKICKKPIRENFVPQKFGAIR